MAIRLNGSAAIYRTANLLNLDANYAISFWLYVIARPGTENYSVLWQQNPGAGNSIDSYNILKIDASTAYFNIYTLTGAGGFSESTASTNISLNTWYHIGIIRSANNSRIMYVNGTAHVTHTANLSGRTASTEMDMGVTIVNPGDYLDGRLAHIKIWQATMTAAQIAAEANVIRPIEVSGLNQWYPTFTGATERLADYSGNGRNWTASGTLSDEDNPPISWGAPVWVVPFVASAGGTLSVNVSDTVTLGETVTVSPSTRAGSVSDTITLSEAVTVAVQAAAPSTLSVSVSDGVTLSETVTARLAAALSVSRSESVTLSESVLVQKLTGACIGGVLRQNTANGRYFENDSGIVFLAGFHTWYNFFNGGASDPPPAFTWSTYTASLIAKGVTHVRGWLPETARHWPSDNTQVFEMLPWARTGPGNAADGHLKFDLSTFNDDFFARLRARCVELGNAGIYVTVVLFDGFHIDNTKPGGGVGDPWAYHPFENGNNINGMDGDTDNDGIGEEIRTTTFTAAYDIQKAYIRKVVDTLNDLDNVLFEISNEDGTYAESWQKALVDYIHSYESGKAKQHPVGMTKLYPGGSNSMLTSSNADWISPDEDLTPAAQNSTAEAWMYDTDHTVGDTTDYKWPWIAALQGYGGAWYMDPWDSTSTGDTTANPTYEKIRNNLGYVVDYVSRIDLENATPQGSLSDTGYALAKTTGAPHQYLAYQSATGNITLDVSATAGVLTVEWLRTSNGTTGGATTVNGGASRTLTNPWSTEDAVVYLWQSTYVLSASNTVTLSESVTVAVQSAAAALSLSVSDTATVSESLTVTRQAAGARSVNVSDSITVGESVTVARQAVPTLSVSVSDTATLTEAVIVTVSASRVSITDSATISEAVSIALSVMQVAVGDSLTLTETVSVTVQVAGLMQVNVSDTVTLTEAAALTLALTGVSVADSITTTESVAGAIGVLAPLSVAVTENVDITEAAGAAMALALGVSVVDTVTVADVIIAYMVGLAHADWTLRDSAPWAWTLADSTLYSWAISDRSKS